MKIKFDIKKLQSTLLFWIEKNMKIKERRYAIGRKHETQFIYNTEFTCELNWTQESK